MGVSTGMKNRLLHQAYSFLFAKRKSATLEEKIEPLSHLYLGLNILCLVYWLLIQFM